MSVSTVPEVVRAAVRRQPDQHERLQSIIDSLEERIAEADECGWLGEVDGLRTSLAAAEQKLTQMQGTANQPRHADLPAPTGQHAVASDSAEVSGNADHSPREDRQSARCGSGFPLPIVAS